MVWNGVLPPHLGGLLARWEFEPGMNDVAIAQSLLKEHLIVRPLSPVCASSDPRVGLVMGVGMLSGETLVREAQRLRRCLEPLLR